MDYEKQANEFLGKTGTTAKESTLRTFCRRQSPRQRGGSMEPVRFEVVVEGSVVNTVFSEREANKLEREYKSEGWNTHIVKIYKTLVGDLGVRT